MKILGSFLILIMLNIGLSLAASSDQSSVNFSNHSDYKSCEKFQNTCKYYTCIESKKHCGDHGYLNSFASKYCMSFKNDISKKMSENGRIWLQDVRSCLIHELSKISPEISCHELKISAFNSHIPCYQRTKFCNLNKWDKFHVMKALKKEIKNPRIFLAGLKILRSCRFIRFY